MKGKYLCGFEVEKMSKSKYNVQTPDELVEKFGARIHCGCMKCF